MKKTLAILACTVLAASLAGAEEVVSSNTVGYTKVNLQPGLNLVAAQFVVIGGETATMNELTEGMTGALGYDDSTYDPTTELRVWTGGGYVKYGWSGNLLKDSPEMAAEMGVEDDSMDNQWLNYDYEISEDPVPPALGFWVKAENAGSITLIGEVPSEDKNEIAVDLAAGLNLVSYPWPVEASLQKVQLVGETGYDDSSYEATTEIRIWTGGGYVKYGWSGNLLEESPEMASEMGIEDHSIDNKWLNYDYEVTEETIPVGTGFWINAPKAGQVIFEK